MATLAATILGLAGERLPLQAQGMSTARRTALPQAALPEGVIPPRADFADIADSAGLGSHDRGVPLGTMTYLPETTGTGVALVDYDGDGLLDIFLVGTGRSPADTEGRAHALYRNLGDLRFRDVSDEAGLEATGWGQGACAGDFDADGRTDLFVTHWGQDALLRNVAGQGFRNEAAERGLADAPSRWSSGCSFLDFDLDGDLDLFVAHYVDFDPETTPLPGEAPQCEWKEVPIPCGPRGLPAESMALFANDGEGRFSEVSESAGIRTAKRFHGLGVLASDFDGDGWTDVFVACDSTANLLFRNRGNGGFEEIGLESGAAYNEDGQEQAGMGVAAADYDGDGILDLVVTNFADDANTIYQGRGNARFRDRTVRAGLATVTAFVGWGTEFVDFDRDGWPDIFAGNGHVAPSVDGAGIGESFAQPSLLFWNRGDGMFHSISDSAGPGVSVPRPSRGAATGDLDNDGDVEIVVVNADGPPSLLQNRDAAAGNWLTVRAVSRAGSDAVGARVSVSAGGRLLAGEVRSGGSYLSQGDLRLHFGLGAADTATVKVTWPTGESSAPREVRGNQMVTLREGAQSLP